MFRSVPGGADTNVSIGGHPLAADGSAKHYLLLALSRLTSSANDRASTTSAISRSLGIKLRMLGILIRFTCSDARTLIHSLA